MGLEDGAAGAVEVEGVVFEERAAAQAPVHHPEGAVERGRLPVALGAEADALGHEPLRCQAGYLVEAFKLGVVDVVGAEVVEVGGEGLGALGLEARAYGELGLGGVPYGLVSVGAGHGHITLAYIHAVVLGYQGVDVGVGHGLVILHELAHGTVVDMVSQLHLGSHLVAVGHGDIVHLVAEAQHQHVAGIGHGGGHAAPHGYALERGGVFPVADHHFAAHVETGADVAKLAVAVGALVEVHEVHVHRIPGYLGIVLCVEVEQRLAQLLQAVYPHLGGREGVHPGDDADALAVGVGLEHHALDVFRRHHGAFVYDLHGDGAGGVDAVDHFAGVRLYDAHGFLTVEHLCAGDPPYFKIVKHVCISILED